MEIVKNYTGEETVKPTKTFKLRPSDGTPFKEFEYKGQKDIFNHFLINYLCVPYWPRWRTAVRKRIYKFANDNYQIPGLTLYQRFIIYKYYTYIDGNGNMQKRGDTIIEWRKCSTVWKIKKFLRYCAWNSKAIFEGYRKGVPMDAFTTYRQI